MTNPTPPQAEQLRVSQGVKRVGNPAFRYILATILILFSMGMALVTVLEKQPLNVVVGAIVLVPLVFGCAAASETTFSFVVTSLKPFVPRLGGEGK